MSKQNLPQSAFQLMDEQDEMQIISDANVQQSLVYEVQGKKTLSYSGIKFLFQKWTEDKSLTVQIIHDQSYCNLDKDDPEPVAEHYLQTLQSLGYSGPHPKTSFEATKIIEKLKNSGEHKKYCSCEKPIPNSINGQTCQTCKKLLEAIQ